jgi:hypothetical protein
MLHLIVDRLRHLVEYVRRLVHGAPLMTSFREHLIERFPESQGPVAGSQLGGDGQTFAFQIDQQLFPALRTLPKANLKA